MAEFTAYIFDRRYSVPTLRLSLFAEPGNEASVVERLLAESEFYDAVELRRSDELVARLERHPAPELGTLRSASAGE